MWRKPVPGGRVILPAKSIFAIEYKRKCWPLGPTQPNSTDCLRGCLHGGRKILVPGRSQKADHPSAICFLYSVYMQRAVLVHSAGIFLVLGSSKLTGRKILAPYKLPSLRRSQYQGKNRQKQRRVVQWLITAIKGDHFVWRYHELIIVIILLKGSY